MISYTKTNVKTINTSNENMQLTCTYLTVNHNEYLEHKYKVYIVRMQRLSTANTFINVHPNHWRMLDVKMTVLL